MSAYVVDLKKQRDRALAKADSILTLAERGKRPLTVNESQTIKQCTEEAGLCNSEVNRVEKANYTRSLLTFPEPPTHERVISKRLSAEYAKAFFPHAFKVDAYKNPTISAALSEGTNSAGGYAVPSLTADDKYVPLPATDLAVRSLATVLETACDLRFPGTSALPTAALRTEGSQASETDSVMNSFTLTANNVTVRTDVSQEFFEDVKTFEVFYGADASAALGELEEGYFVSGSGTGQPQGLLGNVGAGVTGETADGSGNLLSIAATFDVMGTLKDRYHKNASWLMSRASGIQLRKAQTQSNLFAPVFTRDADGTERLHGYPVFYSASMPAIAAGATPVLFGSLKDAYIIGDRGGPAIFMKAIDQDATKALLGLIPVLFYRRVDGKVRRSEAVQGITLHT